MEEAVQGNATEQHLDTIIAEERQNFLDSETPSASTISKRPNAFTELMSAKKPKPTDDPAERPTKSIKRSFDARNGLGLYIDRPEMNPEGLIVEFDDDFVVIKDKFPKASVHLLLIPRNPSYYDQHPLHLLSSNAPFLAEVRKRVERLKILAASELRRKYGCYSASDAPYLSALEELMSSSDPPAAAQRSALLPSGRNWLTDIRAGVHTHPSMNHMHIHVMSRDMHSPCLKHKKHYLSFNSSFFVEMDNFPLEEKSARFHPGDWPSWDMKCWRCGENFKNRFAKLKGHLEEEFEGWRKE